MQLMRLESPPRLARAHTPTVLCPLLSLLLGNLQLKHTHTARSSGSAQFKLQHFGHSVSLSSGTRLCSRVLLLLLCCKVLCKIQAGKAQPPPHLAFCLPPPPGCCRELTAPSGPGHRCEAEYGPAIQGALGSIPSTSRERFSGVN